MGQQRDKDKMAMGCRKGQKWGEQDGNGASRTEMGQGGRWEWGKGGKKWDKERGGNGVRKRTEMG